MDKSLLASTDSEPTPCCGRASLVGPPNPSKVGGYQYGGGQGHLCLTMSPIDEMSPACGAVPRWGAGLCQQVSKGPCSKEMLVASMALAVPAFIHIHFGTRADYFAGFSLICATITGMFSDVFCVDYGVYDNDFLSGYARTGTMAGLSGTAVKDCIAACNCRPQVMAPDRWNNLTRLWNRVVCVFFAYPCVLNYTMHAYPAHKVTQFFGLFLCALLVYVLSNYQRRKNPCGFRFIVAAPTGEVVDAGCWDVSDQAMEKEEEQLGDFWNRKRVLEDTYRTYEILHMLFLFLLVVGLSYNALYGTRVPCHNDPNDPMARRCAGS